MSNRGLCYKLFLLLFPLVILGRNGGRDHTQHNGIQYNGTQHYDTQHK
jgi:hypothetical protein